MRDVLITVLGPGGAVGTILLIFFGVNGWFERRAKVKKGTTTTQAEVTTEQTVRALEENPSIGERWQKYADQIENRLNNRIDRLSEENSKLIEELARRTALGEKQIAVIEDQKRELAVLIDYIGTLRHHITMQYPPPAPDWPEGFRQALERHML